jgi:hypothetical protein
MKPNPTQELLLQKYLRDNLRYNETYAEFYDHILAALEDKTGTVNFETAVNEIVREGFGGMVGMRAIEMRYQQSIFHELRKKYLNYAIDNFKLPGVIVPVALGLLVYYVDNQPWFSFASYIVALFIVRIAPDVLNTIRRIRSPYIQGAPRASIKKGFLKWQNFIPGLILVVWLSTSPGFFTNSSHLQNTPPIILTVLMVLVSLHSLTYYKVYRDDIKTSFTVN